MPRQAHMELVIKDDLDVTLGDVLYYVNTGSSKSQGDLKTINRSKLSKKQLDLYFINNGHLPTSEITVQLNCRLIDPAIVERDFEMVKELEMLKKAIDKNDEIEPNNLAALNARIDEINSSLFIDDYNVARYLDAFNKKVKPLLVCFNPEIRSKILLDIEKIKDKTTKTTTEVLKQRVIFTKSECELVSGMPFKDGDQDSYQELMTMEDKEIKFWDKVNKSPNYMEQETWEAIRVDYHIRMAKAKADGIQHEKDSLDSIFKHLEIKDLNAVVKGTLPIDVFIIADIATDMSGNLISRKWNEVLCHIEDIFKYEKEAMKRDKYYQLKGSQNDDNRYEAWMDYLAEQAVLTGDTITLDDLNVDIPIEKPKSEIVVKLIKEIASQTELPKEEKKKKVYSENNEDDDEFEMEEDENGNLTRSEEKINLDDEFDDTFGEKPDDYVFEEKKEEPKEEEEDEWPF
jgi:acylphosphatase